MGKFRPIFYEIICPNHAHVFDSGLQRVNNKGFSPNLLYVLTLRKSGLGLLMGKFRHRFTDLFARDTTIFMFPDDNLSK